jgi:CHAT domain-containing protein
MNKNKEIIKLKKLWLSTQNMINIIENDNNRLSAEEYPVELRQLQTKLLENLIKQIKIIHKQILKE